MTLKEDYPDKAYELEYMHNCLDRMWKALGELSKDEVGRDIAEIVSMRLSATPSRNDILEDEQVERAAESMCRATYLEWDSLDDKTGTDHLNDDGPETKEWFRYLARAAIRALVKP